MSRQAYYGQVLIICTLLASIQPTDGCKCIVGGCGLGGVKKATLDLAFLKRKENCSVKALN